MRAVALLALVFLASTSMADTPPELPFLHTAGTRIVSESGKDVRLEGVNLGGWMLYEKWLFDTGGHTWPADDRNLWLALEERFGGRRASALKAVFRRNFISDEDFSRIADAGFNCVRLIFWYHDLEPQPGKYNPAGFRALDRAIAGAAKHGLYTIMDFHGLPGGQSDADHTGWASRNALWGDPVAQKRAIALMERIARRYRDRSEIAGYDLMNEPMGAPSMAALLKMTDSLYWAVRRNDKKHIVFIEDGFKGFDKMPVPAEKNWNNVVYSFHHYPFGKRKPEEQAAHLKWLDDFAVQQDRLQVPFFVGEFSAVEHATGSFDIYGKMIEIHRKHGWSWTLFTWKRPLGSEGGDIWAVINQPTGAGFKPFNVLTAPFEEVKAGFEAMHSRNFKMSDGMDKFITRQMRPGR